MHSQEAIWIRNNYLQGILNRLNALSTNMHGHSIVKINSNSLIVVLHVAVCSEPSRKLGKIF